MLIVAAGAAILLTMTPLNLFDVPVREQTGRLVRLLNQNHMIEEGRIVANEHVVYEDRVKITSAYAYLNNPNNYGKEKRMPAIISGTDQKGFAKIFGFEYEREGQPYVPVSVSVSYRSPYEFIDIAGYSYLTPIECFKNEPIDVSHQGKSITVDFTEYAKVLYAQHGVNSDDRVVMEFDIDGDRLICTYCWFYVYEDNRIVVQSFRGYYLEK